jgi:hypothetical protein
MIFSTTYPKFARLVEKRRQPKEATMINRREFTAGVVTTLAAPFVLKTAYARKLRGCVAM